MSNVLVWLIGLVLVLGALRLFLSLLPRWLIGALLMLVVLQVLHPSVSRQIVGAFAVSPLLLLGVVLFGLWLIIAKGPRPRKKR